MTNSETAEPTYARASEVLGAEVQNEIILLHTEKWTYLEFDDIGARIWALIETPRTLSSLVEQLTQEFAVEDSVCRHDTGMFLQDMIEKGFVAAGPAGGVGT